MGSDCCQGDSIQVFKKIINRFGSLIIQMVQINIFLADLIRFGSTVKPCNEKYIETIFLLNEIKSIDFDMVFFFKLFHYQIGTTIRLQSVNILIFIFTNTDNSTMNKTANKSTKYKYNCCYLKKIVQFIFFYLYLKVLLLHRVWHTVAVLTTRTITALDSC